MLGARAKERSQISLRPMRVRQRRLDGERTFIASAGSYVYIPRGTLRRFKNVGEAPAKMLVFFTPPGMEGFFLEVGMPAQEGGTAPPLVPEEVERALGSSAMPRVLLP